MESTNTKPFIATATIAKSFELQVFGWQKIYIHIV